MNLPCFLFIFLSLIECQKIFYIPLDERFATRGMFLNMASLVSGHHEIFTPPKHLLSSFRLPAQVDEIQYWLKFNLEKECNDSCILICSAETLIYGGLINSRISNETFQEIEKRVYFLTHLKQSLGNRLNIFLSTVIMRIPAYNSAIEEAWYWGIYGKNIFLWSFYLDKFEVLQQEADLEKANEIKQLIPSSIQEEFLWRRARNFNITTLILETQAKKNVFEEIWVTLDDNAEFGLNKKEEKLIRTKISELHIENQINIYPGADEVGLTMLAKSMVLLFNFREKPLISIIYRDSTTKNYIPSYEGQPLNLSILNQINAAGGYVINNDDPNKFDAEKTDLLILVNNWSENQQKEASTDQTPENYTNFESYLKTFKNTIVFADVRYANGGDIYFVEWIKEFAWQKLGTWTYAGWNTAGNSLGCCISNGILLVIYKESICKNYVFTLYRLIEDLDYQSKIRKMLNQYVLYLLKADPTNLNREYSFYCQWSQKALQASLNEYLSNKTANSLCHFEKCLNIDEVYYPWNRTFEIGFELS